MITSCEEFDFKVEDNIGIITIHRPPVNAWNEKIRVGLSEIFESLNKRTDVYVVILRADGKGFSGGTDVVEFRNPDPEFRKRIPLTVSRVTNAAYNCRVPIISVIQGYAIGLGFAVASVSDITICSDDSYFQFPEINVGTVGGPFWLKRIIPDSVARYYFYTGKKISVEEMYRFGAVLRVVPREKLMDTAMEIAHEITEKYPAAIWATKQVIIEGEKEAQDIIDISDRMRHRGNNELLAGDPNKGEMSKAFLEHRKPVYDLSFLNKEEK